jgi:AcrR family transcriptional regulator/DNA-binding MarR family transcriptional regulator
MAVRYDASTATPRLRSGLNGLSCASVRNIQRGRMLTAAVDTVEEVGYARRTVAQVIARAGVSRKTFYDVFADGEDCFLAAFEQALSEASLRARDAYERESSWREGIRSALSQVLMFMDEEPRLARLFVVESLAAGATVRQRRAQVLGEFAEIVDEGRLHSNVANEPSQLAGEGVVGGVLALLYARLLEEREEPLTDLLAPLMSMIVLPYLGAETALRELSRPTPLSRETTRTYGRARGRDPLAGLDMRLTYRTVRVLMVVAERPGASNREIAKGSGIADQSQISKLLARLAGLKLVENRGESKAKSRPNAWHLTPRGARLERTVRLG